MRKDMQKRCWSQETVSDMTLGALLHEQVAEDHFSPASFMN